MLAALPAYAEDPGEPPPPAVPTGTFSVGAGYSSDEGFLAKAEVAQTDLFHTGQGLALSADMSLIRQDLGIAWTVPDALGTGMDLRTELFEHARHYDAYNRDGVGGAVTLSHNLDANTRIYTRYRLEAVSVALAPNDTATRTVSEANLGNGTIGALGAGIAYSTLDDPFLPRHGTHLELFGEAADPRVGSDYRFTRFTAAADHARDLGPFTLRLHGHATFIHTGDPAGVPLSERLHHEGFADVRGYGLGSVGSPLGENLAAVGRAELELPLIEKAGLSIAGFFDAGWRDNMDAAFGPTGSTLYRSYGASLIWRSPIGPLRFDWAIPLDGANRDQTMFGFRVGM